MAIHIAAAQPEELLAGIKRAVDEGHIKTWSYDDDGDFTHEANQWKNKAWLRPVVEANELRLAILGNKGEAMSKVTYAVYHGRFIESVLSHFDMNVDLCTASSMPEEGDIINAETPEEGI